MTVSINTSTHQAAAPWSPGVLGWPPRGTHYRLEGVWGVKGGGTALLTNTSDKLCGVHFSTDQRCVSAPWGSSGQSYPETPHRNRYVLKWGVVAPNSLTSPASLARHTHLHHVVLILIHLYFLFFTRCQLPSGDALVRIQFLKRSESPRASLPRPSMVQLRLPNGQHQSWWEADGVRCTVITIVPQVNHRIMAVIRGGPRENVMYVNHRWDR